MMKRFSLTASSHLPEMASCTASSAYWDLGLRCSLVSVFKEARSYGRLKGGGNAEYKSVMSRAFALLLVLCLGCTIGGSPAPAGKQIHIGVDLPLTGPEGPAGLTVLNGVRFY